MSIVWGSLRGHVMGGLFSRKLAPPTQEPQQINRGVSELFHSHMEHSRILIPARKHPPLPRQGIVR